jgi:hypothetical protein
MRASLCATPTLVPHAVRTQHAAGRSGLAWALATLGVAPEHAFLGPFLSAAFADGLASDQLRCASLLFCVASLDFGYLVEWLGAFLEGSVGADGSIGAPGGGGGGSIDLSMQVRCAAPQLQRRAARGSRRRACQRRAHGLCTCRVMQTLGLALPAAWLRAASAAHPVLRPPPPAMPHQKYAALAGVLAALGDMEPRQLRAAWLQQTTDPAWCVCGCVLRAARASASACTWCCSRVQRGVVACLVCAARGETTLCVRMQDCGGSQRRHDGRGHAAARSRGRMAPRRGGAGQQCACCRQQQQQQQQQRRRGKQVGRERSTALTAALSLFL